MLSGMLPATWKGPTQLSADTSIPIPGLWAHRASGTSQTAQIPPVTSGQPSPSKRESRVSVSSSTM